MMAGRGTAATLSKCKKYENAYKSMRKCKKGDKVRNGVLNNETVC